MEETHESTESTPAQKNKSVMILLVVIIVLLAAVVAYFVFADKGATDTTTTGTSNTETSTTAPTGMPSGTPAEFDPATATVVGAGLTPEQHVMAYFDAVVGGDYATAYTMLPTAKQQEYGDEAAFSSQLAGYGITSYTIDGVVENGDETEVTATAVMAGGNFQYLWTFVKDGDNWLVKSRTLPGMN
jgi:uncharacterized protein YxeA